MQPDISEGFWSGSIIEERMKEEYREKHLKRPEKHLKAPEKKKINKKLLLKRIISTELVLTAAASCTVYTMSMERITDRRTEAMTASISGLNVRTVAASAGRSYEKATEQVREERDETVWTTEEVNYRTGADESYDSPGSLGKYSGLTRTGVTYNDWSRVTIGEDDYYILSEYLTTEEPLVTEGGQKGEYQRYALSLMSSYGWEDREILPLIKLWNRESGWNPNSHNGSSGAHGIPQALPASKMASEGSDYYTNGNTQIRWGLNYIKNRYGSPSNAWAHFCSHNWY